jgi:hypothetical protein
MTNSADKALQTAIEKHESASGSTHLSEQYSDKTWLRGLVQAIPYIGGTLDTWVGGPASAAQKKHIEEFIQYTSEAFAEIDEKLLNKEFLKSEEFFALFRDLLQRASLTHDQEKIRLLSQAFASSALSSADSISRDSAIDIISHLSAAHVVVLRTLATAEPSEHYVTRDASDQGVGGFMHASVSWIAQNHPELANLPLEIICNDLARYDLLDVERVGTFTNQDDLDAGGTRGYRPNGMGRSIVSFLDEAKRRGSSIA